MRLIKNKLVISALVIVSLLGAGYSYGIHSNLRRASKINGSLISDSTTQVGSSPSSQAYSICISGCSNLTTPHKSTSSTAKATATSTASQTTPSEDATNMAIYEEELNILNNLPKSTPIPTIDYSRPAPTLSVPPSPNCGNNSDSSYYGNCIDIYCRAYPDTTICENPL